MWPQKIMVDNMSRGDLGRPPQALSPSRIQAQDPGAYLSLDSGSNGNANSPRSPRSAEDDYDYQMNNMSLLKAQLKVWKHSETVRNFLPVIFYVKSKFLSFHEIFLYLFSLSLMKEICWRKMLRKYPLKGTQLINICLWILVSVNTVWQKIFVAEKLEE